MRDRTSGGSSLTPLVDERRGGPYESEFRSWEKVQSCQLWGDQPASFVILSKETGARGAPGEGKHSDVR